MGHVAVRTCDFCDEWDSPDARVLKVTVIGPRYDMCFGHRVAMLVQLGVDEEKATEYCKAQDERANSRKAAPMMDGGDEEDEEEE